MMNLMQMKDVDNGDLVVVLVLIWLRAPVARKRLRVSNE